MSTSNKLRRLITSNLCLLSLSLYVSSLLDSFKYTLPILVQLQFRDDTLAGVDADRYRLAIRLFARNTLEMHKVFETVDRGDFGFTAFVRATSNHDFVIFADWYRADLCNGHA